MYTTTYKKISLKLRFITLGFIFLGFALFLSACEKEPEQYNYSIFAFGTLIDITLYDVDKNQAQTAFEQLQKDFDHYQQEWSPWTNGALAKSNQALAKQQPAQLTKHLTALVKNSMSLSQQSHAFYNPTIGRLINLWQFHRYQDDDIRPPEKEQIQTFLKTNPQMSDLHFDKNNRLLSKNPAVSLNFGAYAKGYGIALGINRLREMGINNAIINAGGDLSVIGRHGKRAWNIGIRHPRNDSILASVQVKNNESVFTSGDYERFYTYDGKRYHHILDPLTGYPTNDSQSVTVIHEDAGKADAAATAIFVAGSERWKMIAKDMGIKLVMLVDAKGDIHMTPAMEKRIKFLNKSPTSHIILSQQL